MGVRGSGHTIAKMLQPFRTPALRLVSVTHPEYLTRMREFFTTRDSGALLLRGAEGEAVAHPRREPAIEFAAQGAAQVWREEAAPAAEAALEAFPGDRAAAVTAAWITEALAGRNSVPRAIAHQVQCCLRASHLLRAAA
jgi:anthranilate phosphoribosyltransferase